MRYKIVSEKDNYLKLDEFINYLRGTSGEEVSLCRNEISSLSHWSSQSSKQQRTIHSHVFDLYSTGGNGAASCLWCLLLTRFEKPFLLTFRRRSRSVDPLGPRPTLIWMRPTYLPTPSLRSFQREPSTSTRRPAYDTTFIPLRIKSRESNSHSTTEPPSSNHRTWK